jgi:hypothetical protein
MRYVYEFSNQPDFENFKKQFLKNRQEYLETSSPVSRFVKIGIFQSIKKLIFFEIKDTIITVSPNVLPGLPIFHKLDKKQAKKYKMQPGFVYIRPFTICFLNTIKQKYDIIIYSSYHREFLALILGKLQSEREVFLCWVTNTASEGPKQLRKFLREGRTTKNTLLIDQDPTVVGHNSDIWVPVPKFSGQCKDATLLFLEKYLLNLAECKDVSRQITSDFYTSLLW